MARRRRNAQIIGLVGFVFACALPVALFAGTVADIVAAFRLEARYLVGGWMPWVLIAGGLAFFVPVAFSAGRDPESRWYPRARNAYAGWGITLYLLGLLLGAQVSQVVRI